MKDDIRPKGTVQVACQEPGCGWSFWVDPLDQRLPDGPFICGANHVSQARLNRAIKRLRDAGFHYGSVTGAGVGSSGSPDDGPGAITLRLHDPELEYRHDHGGSEDNYSKGMFAVFEWAVLAELEQAPLDPKAYEWMGWETAWKSKKMQLPGGTETPKESAS